MKHTTGICAHCGADRGLHHFETEQCPKNGIEETRNGFGQQWEETTFEDSGLKRLRDAAPELLEALKEIKMLYEYAYEKQYGHEVMPENCPPIERAINAIEKATGKKEELI